MPLSFKFNLAWITFNLIPLWCLLAQKQFPILLFTPLQARHPPSLVWPPNTEQWAILHHRASCKAYRAAVIGFFFVIFSPFRHTHYVGSAATAKENCLCLAHIFPFSQGLPALHEMRKNPFCLTYLPHNSPISFPVRDPSLPAPYSPCFAYLVLLYLFHTPAINAN